MSRDTGLDAGMVAAMGEMAMLQKQHDLLQEEVVRLRPLEARLRDSERTRAQLEQQIRDNKGRRGRRGRRGSRVSNEDIVVDVTALEQVSKVTSGRGLCMSSVGVWGRVCLGLGRLTVLTPNV